MEKVEPKTSDLAKKELLYDELRLLYAQLLEAEESDDKVAKRKAHLAIDRYLMERKYTMLPLVLDALGAQIRGIRNAHEAQLGFYAGLAEDNIALAALARLVKAEDMISQLDAVPQKKKPFYTRLFKRSNNLPAMQYATEDYGVTAIEGCTVRLKDGRYGLVQKRHDDGVLVVNGPDGIFVAVDEELQVVLAPDLKVKPK